MKKKIFLSLGGMLGLAIFYLLIIVYPVPLFSFSYEYQQYTVYSDKEIPKEIEGVLDKIQTNLSKSELYDEAYNFNIFICHNNKVFTFLTRNKNAGGLVQGLVSPNVFIRESNIVENRIIPPGGWMYETNERPLSYFIAHELTHSLQAKYDRFLILKVPPYILEGYADYIGKREFFNYDEYRKLFIEGHPKMQKSSPLYNRYHLYIAYLMEKENLSFKDILREKPDIELILEKIKLETNN